MVLEDLVKLVEPDRLTYNYRLWGYRVNSNVPFDLSPDLPAPDPGLTFWLADDELKQVLQPPDLPIHASIHKAVDGRPSYFLYSSPEGYLLSYTGVADFWVGKNVFVCFFESSSDITINQIERLFLYRVLPFWLELRGCPTLHASAVSINSKGVAFLARSGGGKSTMAAEFVRTGAHLVTDDILPLEKQDERYLALPGYPTLKIWPEGVQHFWGDEQDFSPVHPDSKKKVIPLDAEQFTNDVRSIDRIYLLDRQSSERSFVQMDLLSVQEAMITLMRNSFTPHAMKAIGLESYRFNFLAGLASQLPVYRLQYSSDFENLSRIRKVVQGDLFL